MSKEDWPVYEAPARFFVMPGYNVHIDEDNKDRK